MKKGSGSVDNTFTTIGDEIRRLTSELSRYIESVRPDLRKDVCDAIGVIYDSAKIANTLEELDANGIMAFLEQIKVTDEELGQKRGGD